MPGLVPRTRSSRTLCGKHDRELRVQRGTRIIELLVVLRFRSSYPNVLRVLTNFGIGPLVRWCTIACAVACTALPARAQSASHYPDRPIRLVVAFVPGGATDTLTRQLTEDLKDALGQPVIVENRPGANGYLAWNYVASSEPDGYTLLMAENALGISQGLFKKSASSFDPLKQYDALASVAYSPLTLAVANNVKADTMAELIALSRTVPKKMNYASAGVGSVSHLTWEVIRDGAGVETVHVPYKGGGQAMGDIIAGHVDMNMAAVSVAKPLVESGRIKALLVTGNERSPALPNVPTLKETGVKTEDVDLRFWYGLFGPKGIPEPVKAKLEKAVATVMASPSVRERLAKLDITPDFAPGPAMRAKLENEIANWTKFIDAHGIKPE
jgi:tripartite-type tricarboxylate transporter receptor subunit TctC